MPLSHGGDRMIIKPDDNTVVESIKTRDFRRYMAAVEEHIKSTERPVTGRDKDKVG